MTMENIERLENIENAVKAYNDNRDTATATESAKAYASIEESCKELSKRNRKASLDSLVASENRSEVLTAFIMGRGGKSAVLINKTKDGVVRDTIAPDFEANDGISATKAMKMLTELYAALLPEDIRVKPCKCDLHRLHDAVITPKGAKQLKSSKDTLYKQFFMGVRVRTTGNAYEVYAK